MLKLETEMDRERLRQAAMILERENEKLAARNLELTRQLLAAEGRDPGELQLRIAQLEEQLAMARERMFARSSEKRASAQQGNASEQTSRAGHGPRVQPQLPALDEVHELDEPDRACPKCGKELQPWAGQFEESDEVDVIERRFVLVRHKRQKYRCACNGCVETAPGSVKLVAGGRYSLDFAIEVAVQKYLDHLPLERQVRIMAREGLVVDSQTLWDQLNALARALAPAGEALRAHVLSHPVIGADETRWPVWGSEQRSAKWHVWALAAPRAVFYRIEDSRSAAAANRVLGDYQGVVMSDGYPAYSSLAASRGTFTLAHCWAHVRRKLVEAEPFYPREASTALQLIRQLYEVESRCPTGPPGDDMRLALRQERSKPIVAELSQWASSTPSLNESALGLAIRYMRELWPGLVRFLENPAIPIDNNATERALRGVVVGRKNHYGSRSRRGTEVAALMYALLESAKLAAVDPKAYLRRATLEAIDGRPIPLPHELGA